MPLLPDQLFQLAMAVAERNDSNVCPICSKVKAFALVPEIALVPLAATIHSPQPGTVPSALLVCSNCGFLRFHAISTLGFILTAAGIARTP